MADEARRHILITGCSSGIGYAAARSLAERGWQVFATCRKQEDCARLAEEGLTSFRLDYEDPPSIASGAFVRHRPFTRTRPSVTRDSLLRTTTSDPAWTSSKPEDRSGASCSHVRTPRSISISPAVG